MASLKYYYEERALFGSDLSGVILEKDIAKELRRACRHFGVPEIEFEMWDKAWSCYNPEGYDGSPPNFRFSRRLYEKSGKSIPFTPVLHFLHEIAHYLDACQRTQETKALFSNNIHAYVRGSLKIRNAKWHGPRHRAQMVLLVKWWLG